MSKYGDIISKAREPKGAESNETAGQKARKPESQKASDPTPAEDLAVNLSIKVPLRLRQHWAAEAKRHGTTLTAAISEALTARFGEPGS